MTLKRELAVAESLALEAGELLRGHRAHKVEVGHKEDGEIVTAADLESDALIRAGLATAFPGDAIYSEEAADSPARLACSRVWIIDPLDATSDFVAGGDQYVVSIGLAIDRAPVLGVVYRPEREQLFSGHRDRGVTLNGRPVRATGARKLDHARIAMSAKESKRGPLELPPTVVVRRMRSMAHKLARVAAGLDDGAISLKARREWGTCAGVALVLAGGGRATLLDGSDIAFNQPVPRLPLGMVAAGAALHPALLMAVG